MLLKEMSIQEIIAQIDIQPDIPMVEPTSDSVQTLLQIFFGVLAAVAVLIVAISSLLFALSRGNPDKAARARNAIIYSGIGLALALSAQAVVTFVIGNV